MSDPNSNPEIDIAYALKRSRLVVKKGRSPDDMSYRIIARSVLDHLNLVGYEITKRPPPDPHGTP